MVSRVIVPSRIRSQLASLQPRDRGAEVGVGRLVQRLGHQLQVHRGKLVLGARHHVAAEVGVLRHRADRLVVVLLDEHLHAGAHLVVVRSRQAELQVMQRLVHRARRGQREDVRHALGELVGHRRVVHRRAAVGDHHEHVVAVDQLVGGLDRARNLVLVVLDDVLDLAAVDAAGGVGLVEHHAPGIGVVDAPHRRHAGQVGVGADDDLVVRHATYTVRRHGGTDERGGECRRQ